MQTFFLYQNRPCRLILLTLSTRYINTAAAAELLYDAIYQWKKLGSLTITSTSLPFFKDLYSSVQAGTYAASSSTFTSLITAIQNYADGYLSVIEKYTPTSGALSEQFSRSNGTPLSAVDLTWSYASFLTAIARRAGTVPASWGEPTAQTVPSVCQASSATGTYTGGPSNPGNSSCTAASSCAVTFNELETTTYGQNVFVIGSISALGSWAPENAVALSASKYTSGNPLWYATVQGLQPGTSFQYKYIKKNTNGSVTWESDPNRSYTVPCASTATENDTWK